MAELYPFSNRTVELLRAPPAPGQTHRWLAKVACGLRHVLDADTCFAFDRHARCHQILNVTVEGAQRDAELLSQPRAGGETPAAEQFYKAEEAVCAAHGSV